MRLTAREVIRALQHHGFRVPAPATLRDWRRQGLIGPGPGYDATEIIALLRARETRRAVSS